LILSRLSRDLYEISLGDMRGRFHQLVRQVAIIGQQQQAFTVEVETSDRIQPRLAAQ
jgi:hypothetical protein